MLVGLSANFSLFQFVYDLMKQYSANYWLTVNPEGMVINAFFFFFFVI